jgi:transcriptional regulator with XRE-family HTH domain
MTWTPEQQAEALDLIRDGLSYRKVSDRTGVAISTLSKWANEAGITSPRAAQVAAATDATKVAWAQRRTALVDRFGEVAAQLLDRVVDDSDASDAKNLMTAAAIAVDKAQLLSGGVTSRSEQVGLERQRERVLAMRDELADRRELKDGTTGG